MFTTFFSIFDDVFQDRREVRTLGLDTVKQIVTERYFARLQVIIL